MGDERANKRQFCRKGVHTCVPAVTLTFGDGARRMHWCAEHASDADQYRPDSDQAIEVSDEQARAAGLAVGGSMPGDRRGLATALATASPIDLLPTVGHTTRLSVNGSTSIVVTPALPCGLLGGCVAELHITHKHGDTTRLHISARQRRELITALGGEVR